MRKRGIEIEVLATIEIHPEDESIVARWDVEALRKCVFEIMELSEPTTLPGGIRATIRTIVPTPTEIKEAELRRA